MENNFSKLVQDCVDASGSQKSLEEQTEKFFEELKKEMLEELMQNVPENLRSEVFKQL